MSTEAQAPDTGGVESSIREAHGQLPEIARQRKLLKYFRYGMPLGIILILLIGCYTLYKSARTNIIDRKDELASEFQQHTQSILPAVEAQAKESADRLVPMVEQKFKDAQEKARGKLPSALQTASDELKSGMNDSMNQKMNAVMEQTIGRQRTKLTQTFPEQFQCAPGETRDSSPDCRRKQEALDDLLGKINHSYHQWAIDEMNTTFREHFDALADIHNTMSNFGGAGKAAGPAGATAPSSAKMTAAPGEVVSLWLEIVAQSMAGSSDTFEKDKSECVCPDKGAAPESGAPVVAPEPKKEVAP